ncbi:MAG TPA: CHAT domain-containing protein [Candidatus Paceibacterota bacterium]|nr:CHAT domain-containing protein [Verrucomicrobiota bacterium]HRY51804.1 CHAT domain-containing protein [Candidatus Paceibacterota bacterium]
MSFPARSWYILALVAGLIGPGTLVFAAESESDIEWARLQEELERHEKSGQWANVIRIARQMLEEAERRWGPDHPRTADALDALGKRVTMAGALSEVQSLYLRALAIRERIFGPGHLETSKSWLRLGVFARDCQRDPLRAGEWLSRCLAIREAHAEENPGALCEALNALGWFYLWTAEYSRAATALERARQLGLAALEPDSLTLAETASALTWVNFWIRDWAKAEEHGREAWAIKQRRLGDEHWETLESANALAVVYRTSGKLVLAQRLHEENRAAFERVFGRNHLKVAECLSGLGIVHEFMQQPAQARPLLDEAVRILERHSTGTAKALLSDALHHLSVVLAELGDLPAAEATQERALQIRAAQPSAFNRQTLNDWGNLARLKLALGKKDEAVACANRQRQIWEALVDNLSVFTSESQRFQLFSWESRPHVLATLGAAEPLAEHILRTKALVLDSLMEDRARVRASADPSMEELLTRIHRQKCRIAGLALSDLGQDGKTTAAAERKRLQDQVEGWESQMARAVTGLGKTRRALAVTVDEVRRSLPADTALVDFLRYEHILNHNQSEPHYGAMVVTRAYPPRWVTLGLAADVDREVRLCRHLLRNRTDAKALQRSLEELHARIWDPVRRVLATEHTGIISCPDAALAFVPFAALVGPEERFAGEQYVFSHVSSGRDLLVQRSSSAVKLRLAVWANPDFSQPSSAESHGGNILEAVGVPGTPLVREFSFRPLPGAEREARWLAQNATALGLQSVIVRTGREASEEALVGNDARDVNILHLATHGFFFSAAEDIDSWRGAEKNHGGFIANPPGPRANPMLRSGLLLAGARRTVELWKERLPVLSSNDGVVTAEEISQLDLRETDLVVLSMCDSGLGDILDGEGVMGLRRAFIQAGVRAMVLALWPIDDALTSEMILDFYERMRHTSNACRALAQMQQDWLVKLRRDKGLAEAARLAGPFIHCFQGQVGAPFSGEPAHKSSFGKGSSSTKP